MAEYIETMNEITETDADDEREDELIMDPDPTLYSVKSGEVSSSGVPIEELHDWNYQKMMQQEYENQFAYSNKEGNLARPHEYHAMVMAHLNRKIGEQSYTMLIDSGSELNIMTLDQAQELALPIHDSGNSWSFKGISVHTSGLSWICSNVPVK